MRRPLPLPLVLSLLTIFSSITPACQQIELEHQSIAPVSRPVSLPVTPSGLAGSRVAWVSAPARRALPAGVGTFLADVESHLPPEMGWTYRDRNRVTWCHETTHGVHAALRNQYRRPAFYPGGGRCALVEAPAITLGEVAASVPRRFRGSRFQLYLVSQRQQWDRDPLYIWDEWVAYNNGITTGIEEGARSEQGTSDDAIACIELSGYALAVAVAACQKQVPISEQFKEFLAWELRRSFSLARQAQTIPAFAWTDHHLEELWRRGDPFVAEALRKLYGETFSVADLFVNSNSADIQ